MPAIDLSDRHLGPSATKRGAGPLSIPDYEAGNAARTFKLATAPHPALPVIASDGKVSRPRLQEGRRGSSESRAPDAHKKPNLGKPNRPAPRRSPGTSLASRQVLNAVRTTESTGKRKRVNLPGAVRDESDADRDTGEGREHGVAKHGKPKGRKRVKRKQNMDDYAAELKQFERSKGHIAALASAVVSDPESSVGRLKELRAMAKLPNKNIASLVVLTESQLYKDICPAYRIRLVSEEEAAVKVSKDIARLRTYEETLLHAYSRFLKSVISLTKWSPGSDQRKIESSSEKLMKKLRRAACTAVLEIARSLLHFNLAEDVIPVVVGLTADRDPDVRTEACAVLSEVLSETHRCSGFALTSRVLMAEQLSKLVRARGVRSAPETVSPFASISFVLLSKLEPRRKVGNAKPFNRKHRKKQSVAAAEKEAKEAAEEERRERLDLERDLREAQAEATPEELFSAKKRLLNAACFAYFNVIKAASSAALLLDGGPRARDQFDGAEPDALSVTKKPPAALADALEGTLRIASFLDMELLDAILAALSPLLEGSRLPLKIRFRCVSAAYAILTTHAASQKIDADSFTRDTRAMDMCLYTALGCLYGASMPLGTAEEVTAESVRAVLAASAGRQIPLVRSAAFARRLAVVAASLAPTHSCALGLVTVAQRLLPHHMVSCIFPSDANMLSAPPGDEFGVPGDALVSYSMEDNNPDTSGGQQSASWEFAALKAHYHPAVKRVADLCASGVCGDRMPSGGPDPGKLLGTHSCESGGFNPMPVGTYSYPRNARMQSGVSDERIVRSASALGRLALDEEAFPVDYFESLWSSH